MTTATVRGVALRNEVSTFSFRFRGKLYGANKVLQYLSSSLVINAQGYSSEWPDHGRENGGTPPAVAIAVCTVIYSIYLLTQTVTTTNTHPTHLPVTTAPRSAARLCVATCEDLDWKRRRDRRPTEVREDSMDERGEGPLECNNISGLNSAGRQSYSPTWIRVCISPFEIQVN